MVSVGDVAVMVLRFFGSDTEEILEFTESVTDLTPAVSTEPWGNLERDGVAAGVLRAVDHSPMFDSNKELWSRVALPLGCNAFVVPGEGVSVPVLELLAPREEESWVCSIVDCHTMLVVVG